MINTFMKQYFVYLTIDTKRNMFYLGRRHGRVDVRIDKYFGSSIAILNILKSRKPHCLKRVVLQTYEDKNSYIQGEKFWGNLLNVTNDSRFYNRSKCGYGGDTCNYRRGKNHPNYGKKLSISTKKAISVSSTGRKQSDAARAKMSENRIGERNHMFGKTGLTNPNIKTWKVFDPQGNVYIVKDLISFCREKCLNYSSIKWTAYSGQPLSKGPNKGWSAIHFI